MHPKKNIGKQSLEDLHLLKKIESIFKEKRGYIFRMPKPGSKVISLLSGGLDTTIVTSLLLDKYKLEVYPVHFLRPYPAANPQSVLRSASYFCNLFKRKYKTLCHDLIILPLQFPAKNIERSILNEGQVIINNKTGQRRGIPFQPSSFIHEIINYSYTLKTEEQRGIKTIFAATLASNVNWYAYESLTSYRALMLAVCIMLNDFSWQITSFPIEKEMGWYMDKHDLIQMGSYLNLPLEKTFTCQKDYRYQCGKCIVCLLRRVAFKKANLPDKTVYETNRTDVIGKIKRKNSLLKDILRKM